MEVCQRVGSVVETVWGQGMPSFSGISDISKQIYLFTHSSVYNNSTIEINTFISSQLPEYQRSVVLCI